jgi:acyl-CoA synthetase (NDP forming)
MTANAPAWMNVKNPLDVGPSGLYAQGLDAVMQDPGCDLVLAVTIIPYSVVSQLMPLGLTGKTWFGDAAKIKRDHPDKPLVLAVVGAAEFIAHMTQTAGPGVPVLASPETAARALAALARYGQWIRR